MWNIAGIIVVCVAVMAVELPDLVRKRMSRELGLFLLLLTIGFVLSTLQSLRVPIPNPVDWIMAAFKPISEMTYQLLK